MQITQSIPYRYPGFVPLLDSYNISNNSPRLTRHQRWPVTWVDNGAHPSEDQGTGRGSWRNLSAQLFLTMYTQLWPSAVEVCLLMLIHESTQSVVEQVSTACNWTYVWQLLSLVVNTVPPVTSTTSTIPTHTKRKDDYSDNVHDKVVTDNDSSVVTKRRRWTQLNQNNAVWATNCCTCSQHAKSNNCIQLNNYILERVVSLL